VLSTIALLLLFLNLLLNFPALQTWASHRIASYYSAKLHTKVTIGKVDFEFFKKVVLRNVYVQDRNSDTLFYADALKFDIGTLDFKAHKLYLSSIDINKTKVHLITHKHANELNLQFIIDEFASKDTTKSTSPKWDVSFGTLNLDDVDFLLQNQNDTSTNFGKSINFANLRVHHINSTISDIKFQGDTVRAFIENLSSHEQTGFDLKKFTCYVKLHPHGFELDALKIETPRTKLSTDLVFRYKKFSDFDDFVNKVYIQASFKKTIVCFDDVSYFAHGLSEAHTTFTISGNYSGTISHLKGRNMSIGWGNASVLECDASMDGLTDIDNTLIKANISNLVTSRYDIEQLPTPPFDQPGHIKLPKNIDLLKTIYLTGSFNGYISDFQATGNINTAIGNITSSLHLRQDTVNHQTYYKGSIQTQGFNIGTFWNLKDFGSITASVNIEGKGLRKDNADANLNGSMQSLTFKKYTYQSTTLTGELKKGFFSGVVNVNDPHLQLGFNGEVNIAAKKHGFQFNSNITKADLAILHLIPDSTGTATLSGKIQVNLEGNALDEFTGRVIIDSAKYFVHKNSYHLNHLVLTSSLEDDYRTLNIASDYIDADITGHYSLSESPECFEGLIAFYIPSRFKKEKYAIAGKGFHDYNYDIHFKQNTGLTDLFIPTLKIAKGTHLKGHYKEAVKDFVLTGQSDQIELGGRKMNHWQVNASGNHSTLNIKMGSDTLFVSDSLYASNFKVVSNIQNDSISYNINWNNDSANYAKIPGYIAFTKNMQTVLKLVNPVITISDSTWLANNQNMITLDSTGKSAQSLIFTHGFQSIALQGKLSNLKSDALLITFRKFNLEDFKINNPSIKGTVDGTASISSAYSHLFFVSALNITDLFFNNESLGDANVNSYWDNESQSIALNGQINYAEDNKLLSFIGNYYPDRDTENISLDANMHALPLRLFRSYAVGYCSDMNGSVAGNLHVSGNLNKPVLNGNLVADIRRVRLDYLNTFYHSSEINISIVPDTFRITPSPLYDDYGDTAIVSGILSHNHFKNLYMDYDVRTNNFLCLNTTEELNNLYYGKAFASGDVKIYGYMNNIHIDADVTTQKGTDFNIPLSNASEVEESDYIHFISKKDTLKNKKKVAYQVSLNGLVMDFNIHVTPVATAHVIFAAKVGDILTSHGRGDLELSMNTAGDFNMRGIYSITDGNYLFTMQNVISKKFDLEPDGTIQWNGNPYNADINIDAIYKLRSSLQPFFPYDTTHVYQKLFPVNVDLELTGRLLTPQIKFDIDLPTIDEDARQTVKSYVSNIDEMNRQVFSLLVLKSFMPVQEGGNASSATSPSASLGAAINGTEFLSSQFSNWLSSINKNFNIGVNYQPGTPVNPQELQVAVSTELLNGRVLVNSDLGTMGSPTAGSTQAENTNNIVGEVTVQYKVSKDGKLRVKAYNKANDNTAVTLQNSPYTQGAGITYSEGFNTWGELLEKIKSKFKKNSKKEQAPAKAN